MKYFSAGLTKDGLYAEYKKLAKRYHPDVCREENATEIMQEINAEYDSYFVTIQKQEIGVDWDDLFSRYKEAQRSREVILRFLNFDKKAGEGWFSLNVEKVYCWWNSYTNRYTTKYSSDGSKSWEHFHGGFALTRETSKGSWSSDGNRNVQIERIPARIECPTLQDMYFAMLGQSRNANSTELQSDEMNRAHVSMFGNYKHIRTKKGDMWVEENLAYMKVNGLIMSATVPGYLLKTCEEVLGSYTGVDFGYYQFQECSEKDFDATHDVNYRPLYSECLGCSKLSAKKNELYWIDDPVVAYFARIGVLDFYESGENFRMRFGSFSKTGLVAHLHELTIEDAEHIQDYLDTLNEDFEEYVKRLIKRGKIKVVV